MCYRNFCNWKSVLFLWSGFFCRSHSDQPCVNSPYRESVTYFYLFAFFFLSYCPKPIVLFFFTYGSYSDTWPPAHRPQGCEMKYYFYWSYHLLYVYRCFFFFFFFLTAVKLTYLLFDIFMCVTLKMISQASVEKKIKMAFLKAAIIAMLCKYIAVAVATFRFSAFRKFCQHLVSQYSKGIPIS